MRFKEAGFLADAASFSRSIMYFNRAYTLSPSVEVLRLFSTFL